MKPLVSALIVNYNGKNVLKEAINALKKQSYKKIELIVVDNNSTDGSQEFVEKNYKNVKLVQNKKNLGYCGINSGIKQCKGKYIFFTNNDISMNRDCIKRLVETLEQDKSIGIASPKIINYFDKNLSSCGTWISRSFYSGHFKCKKDFRKEIPYIGVALIRKEIINKFGYLFDKDYFIYAEDVDLGLRIRLLGYKVMHIPEAVLYHIHSFSFSNSRKYKLTYLMERNLLSTFIKILFVRSIIIFLPYVIAMRTIAMIKDIPTLKFANAAMRLLAMLMVIVSLPSLIRKRAKIQKMRKKDDKFLLEVFSEKYLFGKQKTIV